MTEWLLANDWAIQGLAIATLAGLLWAANRWGTRPPKPHDLDPMSPSWQQDKRLHRKDDHHH